MSLAPVRIVDIAQHDGQTVTLAGWLYNLRKSGKICFPILRDGSGIIQCVAVKANLPEETFEALKNLTQESSFKVTGKVRAEQRAAGGFELDVESCEVIQRVPEDQPYPITPKEHGVDFLMDHRHLWLRSRRQFAIAKIRHEVIKATRDFFDENGFTLVDCPIFTPAACEGTTTLFEVDYFEDEKVYLTQSGQLYNEANAMAFGKVYCFGPTFRAEKSKTRRHLTEFWMVEPEMAYATLEDVKSLAEGLVCFIAQRVLANRRAELAILERDVTKLESIVGPFPASPTTKPSSSSNAKAAKSNGAATSAAPTRPSWLKSSTAPSSSKNIPPRSKPSTSSPTPNVPNSPSASTCSPPKATAKSSAAANASTITTYFSNASKTTNFPKKPSNGISISAASAASLTPVSAWALNAA